MIKSRKYIGRRKWRALGLILFAASATWAGETPKTARQPSPMHWNPPLFRWHYNPAEAPRWLRDEEAQMLVTKAVASWLGCGPEMVFAGLSKSAPGRMDGINVIGWSRQLGRAQRGLTQGRSLQDGTILERDITLNSDREEFWRYPKLLEKVIAHEVGHALGLAHAEGCDDVMSFGAHCPFVAPETLPTAPTQGDLNACRERYSPIEPYRVRHRQPGD